MDIGIVSSRYAKALLKFANIKKQADSVYEYMTVLKQTFLKVPELKIKLANPVLLSEKKIHLLKTASGCGDNECLNSFFELITKKHRVEIMPFIAQAYIDAYRNQNNLLVCQLTLPKQLNDTIIAKIKSIVESKTKKNVEFAVKIDASIIGGFILEYDAQCLDASITGQLRNMRKKIV